MNLFKRLEPRRFNYQPRYSKPETKSHQVQFRSILSVDHRKNMKRPFLYLAVIVMILVYFVMTGHFKKAATPFDITRDDVIGFKKGSQPDDQSE